MKTLSNSLALIYNHPLSANAPTIMEHVGAFNKYSGFKVREINVAHGFPRKLPSIEFSVLILHYSLFGSAPFKLSRHFYEYIKECKSSLKIAFFQDEYQYCQARFDLVNELGVEIIYSLLEAEYFENTYYKYTAAKQVLPTLTGYVCDGLIEKSGKFSKPFDLCEIDVGYRARPLPFHMGRGAQEKTNIARAFLEHCTDTSLALDIKTDESDRIYGDDWYMFVGNCKFMLGVESGCSIFDLNGDIQQQVNEYLEEHPHAIFEEVENAILLPYEKNINYRMISPRLFECAASRTCMVLFTGNYQGMLVPDRNYIALEKDFSNFDEVMSKTKDRKFVKSVIDCAYDDLILSGEYHYSVFINEVDQVLVDRMNKEVDKTTEDTIDQLLEMDASYRYFLVQAKTLLRKALNRIT